MRSLADDQTDLRGAFYSRIYNGLWYAALPLALIGAGYDAQSRRERRGAVIAHAKLSPSRTRVWVHAASVGEIEGVRPVVLGLRRARPDLDFIITTMTPAGRDAAFRRLAGACQLAPFDHGPAVRAFVALIRPALLIITETELWPNFFLQSTAAGAKVAVINGRVSRRSMRHYRLIKPLLARALRKAGLILAQTPEDARGFRELGARPELVAVAGNTKYDLEGEVAPIKPTLAKFAFGRPILIAGSTGPGEERVVVIAYRDLLRQFRALTLILAPRHLQRLGEVEHELRSAKLSYLRTSQLHPSQEIDVATAKHASVATASPCPYPVLLLDTMGELRGLYQRASVAFVGGSLAEGRGGQSLAEPAAASVPVLFGPHYENHQQLGDALVKAKAGKIVHDATELARAGAEWLQDRDTRVAAGERARHVIEGLAGSTAATLRHLCALLNDA